MPSRLSWRKIRDHWSASDQLELWYADDRIATVAPTSGGFYFYSRSENYSVPFENTASTPVETEAEAKKNAMAHVKKYFRRPDAP